MQAETASREAERLAALRRYQVIGTPAEAEFDDLVKVLSVFCEVPVSLISLVDSDRQWFKAKIGIDIDETPLIQSICAHGILQSDVFVVPDTTQDLRTADNPLVAEGPNFRFYAGAPLETEDGHALGMLCVLDYKPRILSDAQKELLRVMAKQVVNQLELRRTLKLEREARGELEAALARNEVLSKEADHRVKNSLQQVISFLNIQERQSGNPEAAAQIAEARSRVATVASVHDHLHRAATTDRVRADRFLNELCQTISMLRPPNVAAIKVEADAYELPSDAIMALGFAANELIANAVKHAFPEGRLGVIEVSFKIADGAGALTIRDNGVGAPEEPAKSRGLGLRVVNALAAQLHGSLSQSRQRDGGTAFVLRFPI